MRLWIVDQFSGPVDTAHRPALVATGHELGIWPAIAIEIDQVVADAFACQFATAANDFALSVNIGGPVWTLECADVGFRCVTHCSPQSGGKSPLSSVSQVGQ